MALSSVFKSQQKVRLIVGGQDVIVFDCSVSEKHSRESTPTDFEVEDGQSISDHIMVKPFSLHLTGIVTDTPFDIKTEFLTSFASAALPAPAVVAAAAGYSLATVDNGTEKRSVTRYQKLIQLQAQRQPISVWTSLQLYLNMFIKSISVPREASTGQMIQFDLELTQLLLVSPKTVNILKFSNGNLSAGKVDKGKQEVQNTIADQTKKGFNRGLSVLGLPPVQ